MAATTAATTVQVLPVLNAKQVLYITAATADSDDTLDVSADFSTIDAVVTTLPAGTVLTASTFAGTTITIDVGGGRANNAYRVIVWGTQQPR